MIGTLDSARTQIVMESLLQKIVDTGSEIAIIDITGVPTVDTLVAQHLLKTVTAIRLMGADCIISGIRPQIAQTIVHLGVDLGRCHHQGDAGGRLVAGAQTRTGYTVTRTTPPDDGARWPHSDPPDGRGCLLVTIQVDLQDLAGGLALQDDTANKIEQSGARSVLIDISSLEIVDSFIGRMLAGISGMARVLDAVTVVVGMQPAVAITLVELGLSLQRRAGACNVERGMRLLRLVGEERALDRDA